MKKMFLKRGIIVGIFFCYGSSVCSEKTCDKPNDSAIWQAAPLDRRLKTIDTKVETVLVTLSTLMLRVEEISKKQDKCLRKLREPGGVSADAGEQRRERSADSLKEQAVHTAIMKIFSGEQPDVQQGERGDNDDILCL